MADSIRWVGLDVHVHESTIAILDQGTGELITRRFIGRPHQLMPLLGQIERPARMVYEAGPTGYGLARRALAEGIDMCVCAPGHTERPPNEHVKTDKRDAIRLARRLASGELTMVCVPSVEQEQLRDLVRCREDIRGDLMRARHQLGKFLLRREIYYEGPYTAWSRKHRAWLASLRFQDRASQLTLADYLHGHDVLVARRDQLDRELCQLAGDSSWAQTSARLGCLRGIATLSAIGLCAEVGRFHRFLHPDPLAAYLGLVSCENTSSTRHPPWRAAPDLRLRTVRRTEVLGESPNMRLTTVVNTDAAAPSRQPEQQTRLLQFTHSSDGRSTLPLDNRSSI